MLKSGLRFERRCIMQVKVERIGKVSFVVKTRGHTVVSDQPQSNGGLDAGVTPPELFLASLGTCVGYYAAEYLNARDLSTEGLEVTVSAAKGGKPVRIASIQVTVAAPAADHDEHHREGLKRAVGHCLIHNTLV